jgi:hypothetical protein
MLRPDPAAVHPASTPQPAARSAGAKRSSARRRQQDGARPRYRGPPAPRRDGRFIRNVTMVPPAPARIPTPSQTRRASARPLPPLRPLPEAAPAGSRQQPLSRTSACAAPPATRSSSRAAGDPYRTAFAAISLTAITKSSARALGRPARAAHRAVTRRTGRRSSALNRTPHGKGKPAAPARPADSTTFPYPRAGPETSRPVPRGARDVHLSHSWVTSPPVRSSLTTPRISPALGSHRKGWAEVGMGVAAAGGGAVSGPVMAGDGYGTLAAGAVAATVVLPLAWPGPTARTGR